MSATRQICHGFRGLAREAGGVYAANLPVLLGVALPIFAIPAVVNHLALPPLLVFPIAYPIQSAVATLYVGVVSLRLSAEERGESRSLTQLVAEIRPRLASLCITGAVVGAATVVGILCLILPALVVLTMWFVVAPLIALDHLGVAASLRASWRLVRPRVGTVFLISLSTAVFTYGVWLFVVPAAAGDGRLVRMVGSEISFLISAPIAAVVIFGVCQRLKAIAVEMDEAYGVARS